MGLGWRQSIRLNYDSHHVNDSSFQQVVTYLIQGDNSEAFLEYIGYLRRVLEAERADLSLGQAAQATEIIHQAATESPVETYRDNSIAIEKRGRTNAERVRLRENPSLTAESLATNLDSINQMVLK